MSIKKCFLTILILIGFSALTYFYLWPGSRYLFDQRQDISLSDGTDPAAGPFVYWTLLETLKEQPSRFLYGSVVIDQMNPPEGHAVWISFFERIGMLLGQWLPYEQINPWMAFLGIFITLVVTYKMGRTLEWDRPTSFALAIAYGLCAYAKARAKVHPALAGIYFLPLTLLGFQFLRKTEDKWSLQKAAACFLFAAMSPFYYVILLAVISPFFLWFYFSRQDVKQDFRNSSIRLVKAALPAVLFLAFTLAKPVPSNSTVQTVFPKTGESQEWPHPFMQIFAAQPEDFLTNDISWGLRDWNPIRGWISREAAEEAMTTSNLHERTNGIRWIILGLFGLAIFLVWKRKQETSVWRHDFFIFASMALVGFLISLPPKWGDLLIGPSGLVHLAISQFRVPSRAGVIALFGLILCVGLLLKNLDRIHGFTKLKTMLRWPGFLIFLMLFDSPPLLNASPTFPIRPVDPGLQTLGDKCGIGLFFPYVSNTLALGEYYNSLQVIRRTSCRPINAATSTNRDLFMAQNFGLHQQVVGLVQSGDSRLKQALKKVVTCSGMNWVLFDERMPSQWTQSWCQEMNWKMVSARTCASPQPLDRLRELPEVCGPRP